MLESCCGFGDQAASVAVYIANRPPLDNYQTLDHLRPLSAGELAQIVEQTGNHWRKIFNCYAKLAFALNREGFSSWQALRDQSLLQAGSNYQLRFDRGLHRDTLKIICGRQHAQTFQLTDEVDWLDRDFAVARKRRLIVCPYFDYRQLSNVKIERLIELIKALQ